MSAHDRGAANTREYDEERKAPRGHQVPHRSPLPSPLLSAV